MQSPITPFLKETILLLAAKRTMWRKEGHVIDTLVIGSSHGDFGFNPALFPKSFNLCFRSQDLKHSFHLLEKLSAAHPNIKNVVLFYSSFSSGHLMELSPTEKVISPPMSEIFGLDLDYEDDELQKIAQFIKGELNEISVDIEGVCGFFPGSGKGFMPENYSVEKRANEHLRRNQSTAANVYLSKLLDLAAKQKQRVCIVIPPARTDYKKAIGVDSSKLYKSLFDLLSARDQGENITVVNCYDDSRFVDSYFGDYDHLHPTGPGVELLTKSVLKEMGGGQPSFYSSSINMGSAVIPLIGNPLTASSYGIAGYVPSFKK